MSSRTLGFIAPLVILFLSAPAGIIAGRSGLPSVPASLPAAAGRSHNPVTTAPASDISFTDITAKAGINFKHVSSPEKKYIVESMSGGVALFDYDNDGYLDLYLVNSLTVDLVKSKQKTRSALYHNNGNQTFTEVADKAGVGDIGWGMGATIGDYNNDGWDDIYVTCLGPNHLLKNNGDGTFKDVTQSAGVGDPRWSAGAAFVGQPLRPAVCQRRDRWDRALARRRAGRDQHELRLRRL